MTVHWSEIPRTLNETVKCGQIYCQIYWQVWVLLTVHSLSSVQLTYHYSSIRIHPTNLWLIMFCLRKSSYSLKQKIFQLLWQFRNHMILKAVFLKLDWDKTSMSGWRNDGMGKKKLNFDKQNNWTIFHFLYMHCFQKDKKHSKFL